MTTHSPAAALVMAALVCLVAALPLGAADAAPASTLVIPLTGSLPLRPSGTLFGDHELGLFDATWAIRSALAPDRADTALVLDLTRGFEPGLAAAEEIAAVLRSRPAGRSVTCLLDGTRNSAMVIAAACDHVLMSQCGLLMVDGLSMSTDYYADALATIGVRFHAVTSGPAKSAPEPLTRNGPSDAARAEHEKLIHDLDQVLISESLRPGQPASLIAQARAQAPQTPATASQLHLVDGTVEIGGYLKSLPGVEVWKPKTMMPDLSSLGGLLAFWSMLMKGPPEPHADHVVAVVELEGMIVDGEVSSPGTTIAGADTAALFDRLADDTRVAAVVVRVNSGGGSAEASDRIHYAIRRLSAAKPVVALFDGVAASGGYYLGCAARGIVVHRGTITGSIGVFALVPDLSGTRTLLRIHRETIATGPRTDLFSTDAFTPEKEAAVRQVIDDVDHRFQGLVSERRKLSPAVVQQLAGGKVYSGEEAVRLGLADRLGSLPDAVAWARQMAGIAHQMPLERYPEPGTVLERLGTLFTAADAPASAGLGAGALPGLDLATGWGALCASLLPPTLRPWLDMVALGRPAILAWTSDPILR